MRRPVALIVLGLIALFLASACGGGGEGAAAKIAFVSDRDADGIGEIYIVAADGTGLTRLTTVPPFSPESPPSGIQVYAWSPDGKKIAFASDADGDLDIYMMQADGSGQARLTEDPAADTQPRWSPDGKRIAFVSARDGNAEVYVMNADGSGQTRLTEDPADDAYGSLLFVANPWSPDGQRIAFNRISESQEEGSFKAEIYVMDADGSNETRLAEAQAIFSAWSPDGKKMVYLSGGEEGPQVYVLSADGSGQTPLTDNLPPDHIPGLPAWSPDGRSIAFSADRDGQDSLYVMQADGSGQAPLTMGQCDGLLGISWSPDGRRIAFTRGCDFEEVEVWIINADGTDLARIADSPAFFPAWSSTP